MLSDPLDDPLARFRSSMGTSSTEHPGGGRGSLRPSTSPDPLADRDDEDGAQLLRLIDEVTHAVTDADDACPQAGASFMVTASASHSSFALPGAPPLMGSAGSSMYGNGGHAPFAAAAAPPPPSHSPPPPSFAETIAALGSPVPSMAQPTHPATSPPPFGPATGSSAAPPPPPIPPPSHATAEPMIVRNQRGIFLLHPVSRASHTTTSHHPSHATTPVLYASHPAGQSASLSQPHAFSTGTSPPASPLPTYALPPPMPFLTHSMHTHHHAGGAAHHTHHSGPAAAVYLPGTHMGVTPTKKLATGSSPPNYPAPPPYRSPVGKHSPMTLHAPVVM